MLKLYFSTVPSIISTALIIVFAVIFSLVSGRRASIAHWGLLSLLLFFIGLAMSIMSGFKDGVGSSAAVIPPSNPVSVILSILGGLAFVAGIAMLIFRRQDFWQFGFYALSAIIIVKTVMVEFVRIAQYIKGV
jgi:hypothetical protein